MEGLLSTGPTPSSFLLPGDVAESLAVRLPHEGREAGEQDVGDDLDKKTSLHHVETAAIEVAELPHPHGPHVGLAADELVVDDLWGDKLRGAGHGAVLLPRGEGAGWRERGGGAGRNRALLGYISGQSLTNSSQKAEEAATCAEIYNLDLVALVFHDNDVLWLKEEAKCRQSHLQITPP